MRWYWEWRTESRNAESVFFLRSQAFILLGIFGVGEGRAGGLEEDESCAYGVQVTHRYPKKNETPCKCRKIYPVGRLAYLPTLHELYLERIFRYPLAELSPSLVRRKLFCIDILVRNRGPHLQACAALDRTA